MPGWPVQFRPLAGGRAALTAVSAVLLLALAACGRHGPAGPPNRGPPSVGYVVVHTEPVTLTTELPGRTDPFLVSDVRPQVNGIIKARLFTEGSDVKAGQLLYQIDPAPYQASYDQAKAQLANAQANLVTLQLKASRYGDLLKINGVARQDYDDAEAAYKQGVATVAQYQAAVESAAINLGYTRVTAPISGRIGRAAVTPGALVTSGQTTALATIQTLNPIYVDVTESADALLDLERAASGGQLSGAGAASARVRLLFQNGLAYPQEGELKFSDVTVDQTTGSVTLRALFPNPNDVLLPGLYVRAVIVEGVDRDGILAPQQAVTRDEKGDATALVVDGHGKAQLRMLKIGQVVGESWLVLSGLKPGDHLITEGLINVKPGALVNATPAAAGTSGAEPTGPQSVSPPRDAGAPASIGDARGPPPAPLRPRD